MLGEHFTGTLVTDCYAGYEAHTAGAKQKCLAQLITFPVSHEKALRLQKGILMHQHEWLVFLDDPRVPPTNNKAERALRPRSMTVERFTAFGMLPSQPAASLKTISPFHSQHSPCFAPVRCRAMHDSLAHHDDRRDKKQRGHMPVAFVGLGRTDGSIEILDVETGNTISLCLGEKSYIDGLTFSPDGQTLASFSRSDHQITLWHVVTGRELLKLNPGLKRIRSLEFSSDGRWILAAGQNLNGFGEVILIRGRENQGHSASP